MWIKDEPTRQQYPIILVAFYASFTRVIQQLNLSAEEALFQGTMSHINRRFCPFSLSLSLSLSLSHTHTHSLSSLQPNVSTIEALKRIIRTVISLIGFERFKQ